MTRALSRAHRSGVPSLTELWLGAMLRVLVELVLYAASIVRMIPSLLSRECHADVEPRHLPEWEGDIIMENEKAAASSKTNAHRQATCAPPPTAGLQRRFLNQDWNWGRDWECDRKQDRDSNRTPDRTTTIFDTSSDNDDDSDWRLKATTTIFAFHPGET